MTKSRTPLSHYLLKVKQALGLEPRFLCDRCAYDYDGACHNRDRPNVTACDEYRRRGR